MPLSDTYTCVLVKVDQFSKTCKLMPLPQLPTSIETAETLFNQVFHYFEIPEDVVSDGGQSIYFSSLEGLLQPPQGNSQPYLRILSSS